MLQPASQGIATIPNRLPAVTTDKMLICLRHIGEMVIHMELVFAHRLDVRRLERALQLVLDAEPVLGCRIDTRGLRTVWERVPPAGRANFVLAQSQEEFDAFLLAPHAPETGPALKGCLWQAPEGDCLRLKIAHEAADAGGLKESAARLAEIYSRLAADPAYMPEPNLQGARGLWQILRRIPWRGFFQAYANYLRLQWRLGTASASQFVELGPGREGRPVYVTHHFPAARVAMAGAFAKKHGGTLNDVIMTAYLRAIARASGDGGQELRSAYTADLRRHYLPSGKGEGICNLSGIELLAARVPAGAGFMDLFERVLADIKRRKQSWLGLSDFVAAAPTIWALPARWSAALFGWFFSKGVSKGILRHALTNMGPITEASTRFDEPAQAAWLIVPPMFPPVMGLGMTGYAGTLTLSCGTYAPGADRAVIERIFRYMDEDFPG